MKNLFSLLLCLSFLFPLSAQLKMGVKASYSKTSAQPQGKEFVNYTAKSLYNLDYKTSKDCASYGVSFYSEIGQLFFQSDMMFRKCTHVFRLNTRQSSKTTAGEYEESYSVFHLPIAGGVNYKALKLGAGPVFNFGLEAQNELVDMDGFDIDGRPLSMGFQFLIGIKLNKHVHIDLKRELSFNTVVEDYYFKGLPIEISSNPHLTTISLGFYL